MASTLNRKRPRTRGARHPATGAVALERYLVDAQGKRIAVVLDLIEYRRLVANAPQSKRISHQHRAELVVLARAARGSWKATEGRGTSVEIVRRLRDEWR